MRQGTVDEASTTPNDGCANAKTEAGTGPHERLEGGDAAQGDAKAIAGTISDTEREPGGWVGKLPEDLANLGAQAWNAIVREAEEEAPRGKEWANGAARMIDENFDELCAERESLTLQCAMRLSRARGHHRALERAGHIRGMANTDAIGTHRARVARHGRPPAAAEPDRGGSSPPARRRSRPEA